MQCRREAIAALRTRYDLDRRLSEFRKLHRIQLHSSALLGCTPGNETQHLLVMPNPQFSLPGQDRLLRLYFQTLYEAEGFPLIDFLLDIVERRDIDVDAEFTLCLSALSDLSPDQIDRHFVERERLSDSEQIFLREHLQRQLVRSGGLSGPAEKKVISALLLKLNELTLLLRLTVARLTARSDNPFDPCPGTAGEGDTDDLIDNLAMEYSINGRTASEKVVSLLISYHALHSDDHQKLTNNHACTSLLKDDQRRLEVLADAFGFDHLPPSKPPLHQPLFPEQPPAAGSMVAIEGHDEQNDRTRGNGHALKIKRIHRHSFEGLPSKQVEMAPIAAHRPRCSSDLQKSKLRHRADAAAKTTERDAFFVRETPKKNIPGSRLRGKRDVVILATPPKLRLSQDGPSAGKTPELTLKIEG